jgi:uncharacterized protein YjbI with pentapeptide repeats
MANGQHLEFIKKVLRSGDSAAWNNWRASNSRIDDIHGYMSLVEVDLSGVELTGAWSFSHLDLADVNFQNANLEQTNFHSANLRRANLRGARLSSADLRRAVLDGADLSGAHLRHANLGAASLIDVNLSGADLYHASLFGTRLQRTNLQAADLSGCSIYGVSAWDLELDKAIESDLVITPPDSPTITVDNLEVAQFVYLLLNNQAIRRVIDTITSKAVLILGRFTEKRKPVLDAMRQAVRERNYLPILFDFDKPSGKTLTETISTLAHMARFIIADITSAKSIPQELAVIVPHLPTVPVQPILAQKAGEYAMFEYFKHFPWVLELYRYKNQRDLIVSLSERVIAPAEAKAKELTKG